MNLFLPPRRRFALGLSCDFRYKIAATRSELRRFWDLRREIFCREQEIFADNDADDHDQDMLPIICVSMVMGMEDEVAGVVRIDERAPGVWWGSRLGVRRNFRRVRRVSPSVACRHRQPSSWRNRSIGGGLIFKAVSTARGLGCHSFLAEVQERNAPFFASLHWKPLGQVQRHGLPHIKMQADLNFYPPVRLDEDAGFRTEPS